MSDERPTIKAIEAVQCIRAGMSDAQLMERFNISAKALEHLFEQLVYAGIVDRSELLRRTALSYGSVVVDMDSVRLPETAARKPIVDAADALACLRQGMDEAALMKRYNLSARGVQSLFRKLRSAGFLEHEELPRGSTSTQDTVSVDEENEDVGRGRSDLTEIHLPEVAEKIHRGTDRQSLMETYDVSSWQLERLLTRLMDAGLVARVELESRLPDQSEYYELRQRDSHKVLFGGEASSLAALLERAVAAAVDLTGCDLRNANLFRSVLHGARLSAADLTGATLVRADLSGAKLRGSILRSADMHGAILYKANLEAADLSDANLTLVYAIWAFLPGANLAESNLTNANFLGAHLAGADFFESILIGTNMRGAYMEGAKMDLARRSV